MQSRFACALAALILAAGAPAPAQTFTVPVEYFKLDNGLKVVVSTDRSAPVAEARSRLLERLHKAAGRA